MASVLVVDASAETRALIGSLLVQLGHRAIDAESIPQAGAILERDLPDLLIMETRIAGEDGWHLARSVRAHASLSDLPIIVYTSDYPDAQHDRTAEQIGHTRIVPKAGDINLLRLEITTLLTQRGVVRPERTSESRPKQLRVIVTDDDPDDREFIRDALQSTGIQHEISFAIDGQDLLDRLRAEGEDAARRGPSTQQVIVLLDLNMPKKDGREALAEIKADKDLRTIPVVVLTTSNSQEDIRHTYDLGANSYITKPSNFGGLVEAMRTFQTYWLRVAELPPRSLTATS